MTTRRHALLIGVEKYQQFVDTDYCHADVDLLTDTLVQACDYPPASVKTLKLQPGQGVSPSEILKNVEDLAAGAARGDTLLFYFAGHGHLVGDIPYLVLPDSSPHDWGGTALLLSDVADRLRLDDRNCFRILDACHSGKDVRDGGHARLNSSGFMRAALAPGQGWVTFAACAADEKSYADPGKGNGVFTYFLSQAIRKIPHEEHVYLEQIKLDVCREVEAWASARSYQQRPAFNTAIVGNVPLAIRCKAPPPPNTIPVQVPGSAAQPPQRQASEFSERLAAVRSFPRIVSSEETERLLEEMLTAFRKGLLASMSKFAWSGETSLKVGELDPANAIPYEVKQILVPHIRESKIIPQHEYTTEVEREANPFGDAMRGVFSMLNFMQQREPRVVAIHHTIEQNGFPNSYVGAQVECDGVVPDAYLFGYLAPLQTAICFISGSIVKPVGATKWKHVQLRQQISGLSAEPSTFFAAAETCASSLAARLRKEAETMVEYLEWEANQLKGKS